ncbi:MAG: hypothetical protein WCO81_11915 [Cyanobacteriota bacterium ELA615]|jgi:hypothetical protein
MLDKLFPLSPSIVAGSCLWSLALYLSFSDFREWFIAQIEQTLSINLFYASISSIIPFLLLGFIANYLAELALGNSWGISLGILFTISSGIYQLGRHDNNNKKEQ